MHEWLALAVYVVQSSGPKLVFNDILFLFGGEPFCCGSPHRSHYISCFALTFVGPKAFPFLILSISIHCVHAFCSSFLFFLVSFRAYHYFMYYIVHFLYKMFDGDTDTEPK